MNALMRLLMYAINDRTVCIYGMSMPKKMKKTSLRCKQSRHGLGKVLFCVLHLPMDAETHNIPPADTVSLHVTDAHSERQRCRSEWTSVRVSSKEVSQGV